MSGQAETSTNALVRSGCCALAPATGANPLVSRGIADLVGREPARGASGLARVVDEARLVVQGILQQLVDTAGDRGYLTYHEVREPIGFEIYRIEPDADLKTLPESPLNRESLKQLLAALEERDIEVIPDELEFVFDSEFGGDTHDAWREWREVEEAERVLRENPRNPDLCERFALLLLSCTHGSSDELRAVRLARFACKLTNWKDGAKLATLAAAHAANYKYEKAEHYQRKAIEDPAYAGTAAHEGRERLALYEEMNLKFGGSWMPPEPFSFTSCHPVQCGGVNHGDEG